MTTLHARIFSILWLVIFAVITTAGFIRWGPETVRTDIEDLLPKQALETRAGTVLSHIAKSSAQDVWILVLHPDRTQAKKAVDQIRRSLETAGFKPFDPAAGLDPAAVHRALFPYRENFLTDKDRAWLESADDKALLARAMRILYRPIAPNSWRAVDDPLGLFENWIASQSSVDRFTIVDGRTAVLDDEKHLWFILQLKSESAVSAVDGQKLTQAIAQAQTAAKAATDDNLKVISAGIPLMSEEIAHQASSEATFIGTISALVIAALVLVFFARLVPLMQTLAVLGISIIFAAACVVALFGEIHAITIVFGATLLGICVDYVFHLLCAVSNNIAGLYARERLFRPLLASLLSTIASYLIMLITPETSEERVRLIDTHTSGFIYMVSSAATTGAQKSFDEQKQAYFQRIDAMNLRNPRLVGFGVSNKATYEAAASHASGAIIGSKFIQLLKSEPTPTRAIDKLLEAIME